MIWIPDLQQVMCLHEKVAGRTGGSAGVRDIGLVESALMRASAQFAGMEAYTTVEEKAAAICCGLIGNHGFIDGNKRIGITAMLLMLRKNGVVLNYTQEELIRLGMEGAQGKYDVEYVAGWINAHSVQENTGCGEK